MYRQSSSLLAATVLLLASTLAFAQTTPPVTPAPPVVPVVPAANPVAAMVNGQPVYEVAVQRSLRRAPPERRAVARAAVLDFLIENVLVEQYLQQMQVVVDPKVVDQKLADARAEIKKTGKEWENWLAVMELTEAELRQEITADLRWNQFAVSIANDKVLREQFEANKEMYDGTQVHARHIFLDPKLTDPKACEEAVATLRALKQQIEKTVADGLQKLPPDTMPRQREEARCQLLEDAFAAQAKEKSKCPSKSEGGDLHFFPRVSDMVEPFSKAAFALKPYEMSDIVQTPYGYHLILIVERAGTREVKFEDVKSAVLEVYCDKKRDEMVKEARQKSRIEIAPVAKP